MAMEGLSNLIDQFALMWTHPEVAGRLGTDYPRSVAYRLPTLKYLNGRKSVFGKDPMLYGLATAPPYPDMT